MAPARCSCRRLPLALLSSSRLLKDVHLGRHEEGMPALPCVLLQGPAQASALGCRQQHSEASAMGSLIADRGMAACMHNQIRLGSLDVDW